MATKREKCSSSALFELDENSSIPIWLQLKNRFIYLITSDYYLPGDQLPTVRGLAVDVEVNYNTVSKVYMSLEQDGYIQSKRRQGAFVCDVSDKPGVNIASTAEIVTVEYLKRCFELGMSLEDVEAQFYASLQDAKAKRDKGEEAKDDEANEHTAERAPARIVVFSGCAEDTEQRPAGNGA